jgi:hypothetical protein
MRIADDPTRWRSKVLESTLETEPVGEDEDDWGLLTTTVPDATRDFGTREDLLAMMKERAARTIEEWAANTVKIKPGTFMLQIQISFDEPD